MRRCWCPPSHRPPSTSSHRPHPHTLTPSTAHHPHPHTLPPSTVHTRTLTPSHRPPSTIHTIHTLTPPHTLSPTPTLLTPPHTIPPSHRPHPHTLTPSTVHPHPLPPSHPPPHPHTFTPSYPLTLPPPLTLSPLGARHGPHLGSRRARCRRCRLCHQPLRRAAGTPESRHRQRRQADRRHHSDGDAPRPHARLCQPEGGFSIWAFLLPTP